MNYIEATNWIKNIERAGSDYGIERMRELLVLLDEPDKDLKFIHVAGTNGKGSVTAYLTSVLKEAGYKVGTYNSPSVFRYNERWLINGEPLADELVAKYLTIVRETIEMEQKMRDAFGLDKFQPTAFEIETAVMFLAFYEAECDVCVLETGLGGRWDATNVIYDKELAVITPIGLDHCDILGHTLSEIASEKAAIIKDVCVTVEQAPEIMAEIRRPYRLENGEKAYYSPRVEVAKKAEFLSGDLTGQKFLYDGEEYEISLLGRHQIDNASLAICAIQELRKKHFKISDEALKSGLKKAVWHARIEVVREGKNGLYLSIPHDKVLVLDGSHNPHGAKTLANWLDEYCREKRVALVLGILRDKDYRGIVETLLPRAKEVVCITPPSPRALDKDALLKVVEDVKKEQRKQVKTTTNEDIKQAVQTALNGDAEVVVLCGSLTLFSALV
ncbi:MAG: bifunctional folylpolyglutamate synthase/dihydrofolate synthase [Clostridia bacterium]|nr:bifunctional folylpolyglutamate synthase/dihydrofolate synthase [Clostridia bacterium]